MNRKTLLNRFEEKFIPEPNSGCWLWLASMAGKKEEDSYGRIRVNGSLVDAHRVSWELYKGPIPKGLWVLHKCDVRCCVNPEHLYIGTPQNNVDDRENRGRHNPLFGENCSWSKLSYEQVEQIRKLGEQGIGLKKLSKLFGVCP